MTTTAELIKERDQLDARMKATPNDNEWVECFMRWIEVRDQLATRNHKDELPDPGRDGWESPRGHK